MVARGAPSGALARQGNNDVWPLAGASLMHLILPLMYWIANLLNVSIGLTN
jgi:hypothetical protein